MVWSISSRTQRLSSQRTAIRWACAAINATQARKPHSDVINATEGVDCILIDRAMNMLGPPVSIKCLRQWQKPPFDDAAASGARGLMIGAIDTDWNIGNYHLKNTNSAGVSPLPQLQCAPSMKTTNHFKKARTGDLPRFFLVSNLLVVQEELVE